MITDKTYIHYTRRTAIALTKPQPKSDTFGKQKLFIQYHSIHEHLQIKINVLHL